MRGGGYHGARGQGVGGREVDVCAEGGEESWKPSPLVSRCGGIDGENNGILFRIFNSIILGGIKSWGWIATRAWLEGTHWQSSGNRGFYCPDPKLCPSPIRLPSRRRSPKGELTFSMPLLFSSLITGIPVSVGQSVSVRPWSSVLGHVERTSFALLSIRMMGGTRQVRLISGQLGHGVWFVRKQIQAWQKSQKGTMGSLASSCRQQIGQLSHKLDRRLVGATLLSVSPVAPVNDRACWSVH